MDQLTNLIPSSLYIVTVALVFIGMFLKQTDKVKDTYIIVILTVLGIAGALVFVGQTPTAVVQGILCAAVAVYSKNFQKQIKEQLGMTNETTVVTELKQSEDAKETAKRIYEELTKAQQLKQQEPVLGTVEVTPEEAKQIVDEIQK